MFDIAWSEFLLVGAVALVVIGPKELPRALRTVGQAVGKIRRMASEFQGQFNDAMREAELQDLKKQVDDIGTSVQAATNFSPIDPIKDDYRRGGETEAAADGAVASSGLDDAARKEAEARLLAIPEPEPLPEPVFTPIEPPATDTAAAPAEKPKRSRAKPPAGDADETPAASAGDEPAPPRKRKTKTAEAGQPGGETAA